MKTPHAAKKCGLLSPHRPDSAFYHYNYKEVVLKTKTGHIKHGGIDMNKLNARLTAVSIMLVGLLLLFSPASLFAGSFPNDAYPHYGKDGITCNEHMDNLQLPPSNMVLCKRQSGATYWWAEVLRPADNTLMCALTGRSAIAVQTFPCGIQSSNPPKTYRGYVHWYVGNSPQMNSTDQYFKK
jgi:hypothetical protein